MSLYISAQDLGDDNDDDNDDDHGDDHDDDHAECEIYRFLLTILLRYIEIYLIFV